MLFDNKKFKINNILSLVKLGSIIIISIVFIKNSVSEIYLIYDNFLITISFMIKLFLALLLTIAYYSWSYILFEKINPRNLKNIQVIESVLFLIFFMGFILLTGKDQSPYKIIFLFVIIPVSIQFGSRYGIVASCVSSVFILILDLTSGQKGLINVNFENDIIISSIFIVISWLLSYYVKIEKEHSKILEYKANTDVLTGLNNHRFFHDKLEEIYTDSSKRKDLSLIFFDIDYFKDYNDMFGHLRGDIVLKLIGLKLRGILSDRDVFITRYGGDEFAIIVPDKTRDQVCEIAEKIRLTIEKMHFEGQEHLASKNLTVSIGIAFYDDNIKGYIDFIKRADDALYKAKFTKRNKVEVFSSVYNMLESNIQEDQYDIIASIKTLISVINAKDKYTYGHVERVVRYVKLLAEKLELSKLEKRTLIYGAYIHDIGKINIPEYILNKKMPLLNEEWDIIKQHPVTGIEIISKVESLKNVIPLVMHHHERYDGAGYPDRLKGQKIPYLARVLTVADSFDAMTFSRPYKPAMTYTEAIEELKKCSSTQFDPYIVEIFINTIMELNELSEMPENHE